VRKYLGVYKGEVTRVREILAACVFKIQKMYRGCLGRKRCQVLRLSLFKDNLLDKYQTEAFLKEEKLQIDRQNEKLQAHYRKERQEERSARFTGLTNPKLHNGKKMAAFHESSYGYDDVQIMMDDYMEDVVSRKNRDDEIENQKKEKGEWIRQEQLKDKGRHAYFEDQVKARRIDIIKRLTKERPVRSVKDLLQKHNSKNIKFTYPSTCYADPLSVLKEEIVHNKIIRDKEGRRVKKYDPKAQAAVKLTREEEDHVVSQEKEEGEGKKKTTRAGGRRGGMTIEIIEDMKKKDQGEQAERAEGRRNDIVNTERRQLPTFIKRAEAGADSAALSLEPLRSDKKTGVEAGDQGRRRGAKAAISNEMLDLMADSQKVLAGKY